MRGIVILAGMAALAVLAAAAWGDDPPVGGPRPDPKVASDPKTRAKIAALAARHQEYARVVAGGILIRCPTCEGKGWTRGTKFENRRVVPIRIPCSYCKESGKKVSDEAAEKILWRYRSPLWRALPDSRASVDARREALQAGAEDPPSKLPVRVVRSELVGDVHGLVAAQDGDGPVVETRWFWARDPRSNETTWWIYSPESDGEWGSVAPGAAPKVASRPLTEREAEEVKLIFAAVKPAWTSTESVVEGEVLVLNLRLETPVPEESARHLARREAIAVTRSALRAPSYWNGLRMVFFGPWRDEFGAVVTLPWMTTEATAELVGRLLFDNLTEDEILRHFRETAVPQPGHTPWWKER